MLVDVGEEPDPNVLPGVPGPGGDSDDVAVVAVRGGHPLQAVRPVHPDVLSLEKERGKWKKMEHLVHANMFRTSKETKKNVVGDNWGGSRRKDSEGK